MHVISKNANVQFPVNIGFRSAAVKMYEARSMFNICLYFSDRGALAGILFL
jgi:hypothetical protein